MTRKTTDNSLPIVEVLETRTVLDGGGLSLLDTGGNASQWIHGLYERFLQRDSDVQGANFWMGTLDQGTSPDKLLVDLLTSPEYTNLRGAASGNWVRSLYRDLFLRQADPEGLSFWVDQLSTGVPRAVVAQAFLSSSEFSQLDASGITTTPRSFPRPSVVPNDPSYSSQWALGGTNGIGAPTAWDTTTGKTTVTVAVIDTGVDYDHPDLYLNIWVNQAEIPASRRANLTDTDNDGLITFWDLNTPVNQGSGKIADINGDNRISASDILAPMALDSNGGDSGQGGWANGVSDHGDPAHIDDLIGWNFFDNNNRPGDDNGHGTHIAGTIGAIGNNGIGVTGINWKVQIMPMRFIGNIPGIGFVGSDVDAVAAVQYATANGARISNNSYGDSQPGPLIQTAVNAVAAQGHLFVVAAGNAGSDIGISPTYPAAYHLPNMIVVAATDISGAKAGFSNFSSTLVDVGAPGAGILSTYNGGYAYLSGTSMATPHVAGVAALVLSRTPLATYSQLKNQVLSTGKTLSSLSGITVTGYLVSASQAVTPLTLIDNGQSGYSETGSWSTAGGPGIPYGYNGSLRYVPAGTGDRTASWAFSGLSSGTYDVQVTWRGDTTTRATNAPYQIFDGNTLLTTVRVNQGPNPSGPTVGGVTFQSLGQFTITSGSLKVVLSNDANDYVLADAAQVLPAPPPPPPSTNTLIDNGQTGYSETGSWSTAGGPGNPYGYNGSLRYVPAGTGDRTASWAFSGLSSGTYDVQVTWRGDTTTRATNAPYQIFDGNTLLTTVRVNQGPNPSGPTVGGVTFQSLGQFTITSGSLKVILSNDANDYVLADAARVLPASPANLVDDGQSGYSETGSWSTAGGPGNPYGYNGSLRYVPAGTGDRTASWAFSGLSSGTYDVQVTWRGDTTTRATNAPYQIFDGNTLLTTVRVNQGPNPSGPTVGGVTFQSLGQFTITSGSLKVVLSNDANDYVLADAARVLLTP